jgi:ABC-type lipoprotein release transport system permease subunit
MTSGRVVARSLAYYWRTHAAIGFGVACAVAVFAGALLVGHSVRASLRDLAVARLGRTDGVVTSEVPFPADLATRLKSSGLDVAPLWTLQGVVTHQSSGRRADGVQIFGVDDRFFDFHGVARRALPESSALLSADLADELRVAPGEAIVLRVSRPTDFPLDSLHAQKQDSGRSIQLSAQGILARSAMGDFSLAAQQGPVRGVFVPLSTIERGLDLRNRVNALLVRSLDGRPLPTDAMKTALARAVVPDDYGLRFDTGDGTIVSSTTGLIGDAPARAIHDEIVKQHQPETGVLTWLANTMRDGDRVVPYSLVSAIGPDAGGDTALATFLRANSQAIVLNDWAARDLHAKVGDTIDVEYYRWADEGHLVTDRATFTLSGVVPIQGLTADRRLTPTYPGITTANSLADWDPPFPIDLKLVRPMDDEYWRQYRTTPKAFIPLEVGQRLWKSRHGQLTSVRTATNADSLRAAIARAVDPGAAGFDVMNVRQQNLAASAGATDFGEYFAYFSAFLMVSALLLTALFFRLSVEQRLSGIGVMRAAGLPISVIRRLFLVESLVVAIAGGIAGVALAIAWAALMMFGLRTWWIGAVGTTHLQLHLSAMPLLTGAASGALAALLSIAWSMRAIGRISPRALLSGQRAELSGPRPIARFRGRAAWLTVLGMAAAVGLSAVSLARLIPAAAGFFGAGTCVLVAGLAAFHGAGSRFAALTTSRPARSVTRLGLANLAWRQGRSLTAVGLVAASVFVVISVDAFRQDVSATSDRASGTGGFSLIAESGSPIADNPSTTEGRHALGLDAPDLQSQLAGVNITALRLRPGDDASCLNLYQPARPRVLGVPDRFIEAARFRFASTQATTETDSANPWRLLLKERTDGTVPAIADATSLEYVLHKSVGDELTIDADTAHPVRLTIVAALSDSMLQGELIVEERAFVKLFPAAAGYRVFLIDVAPPTRDKVDAVTSTLETTLEPYRFDAQDAARRLEAYHRVENTYLSTFQTLGALGILLGCLGLGAIVARNVLERRRELALLGAAGFSGADLQRLVLAEQGAVILAGLTIGVVAAIVAIAPVVISRGVSARTLPIVWVLLVAAAGFGASWIATRAVRRLPLVASLRAD